MLSVMGFIYTTKNFIIILKQKCVANIKSLEPNTTDTLSLHFLFYR